MGIKPDELELFHNGESYQSYNVMGAHIMEEDGVTGVRFTVWAPNAKRVSVVGDFNNWHGSSHVMERIREWGIWSLFIPGLEEGDLYKYEIETSNGEVFMKADPYAFFSEVRPATASRVYNLNKYVWKKHTYLRRKRPVPVYEKPVLIYEVHLGSWRRKENGDLLSYKELAEELVNYAADMGYTHIELLPLAEHPFDGSWGYQGTGYYSITSRYGTPEDFMYFVDKCHEKGLGVIVDWVPGHFCKDAHGLARFDGTPLFENENPLISENYKWGTLSFDFEKPEVRSFLISNAYFLFDVFHIDGIRVDAVANLLYLNFEKEDGRWIPNEYGGSENLHAIEFIKRLNEVIFKDFPNAIIAAEDSTTYPLVTRPLESGGLGFNYKWNMGWMNDTLRYMEMDPLFRSGSHNLLTFSFVYTFSENFILPLSHDEVVHGKSSLISKMYGDYWQKFASLRALYAYMMAHPGKKLLFMGGEFGQFIEWNYKSSLDWNLLEYDMHRNLHYYVKTLNNFYKKHRALWEVDHSWDGFTWINADDNTRSIVSFIRKGKKAGDMLIFICNFTPVVYEEYRVGVPLNCRYKEIFNSDLNIYGGSGVDNSVPLKAEGFECCGQPYSIVMKVPPYGAVFLKPIK